MRVRTVILVIILLVLAAGIGSAIGRWTAPGPEPPLPPDTVIVEKVREIEVPIEVPGPATVVERIEWRTRVETVEGPERIREVVRVVERAAELGQIQGRIDLLADKFEGLSEGRLAWGWSGSAACLIRAHESDPWVGLIEQPFDLASSSSISVMEPRAAGPPWPPWRPWTLRVGVVSSPGVDLSVGRRWPSLGGRLGWYAGGQVDLDPDEFLTVTGLEDESFPILAQRAVDDVRIYAGLSFSWGRGRAR